MCIPPLTRPEHLSYELLYFMRVPAPSLVKAKAINIFQQQIRHVPTTLEPLAFVR